MKLVRQLDLQGAVSAKKGEMSFDYAYSHDNILGGLRLNDNGDVPLRVCTPALRLDRTVSRDILVLFTTLGQDSRDWCTVNP